MIHDLKTKIKKNNKIHQDNKSGINFLNQFELRFYLRKRAKKLCKKLSFTFFNINPQILKELIN